MQDTVVYLLQHEFELEGREESFMLGVFSDRQHAEEAQAYFETQPGFRDHLDGFTISETVLNQRMWSEGFVLYRHRSKRQRRDNITA